MQEQQGREVSVGALAAVEELVVSQGQEPVGGVLPVALRELAVWGEALSAEWARSKEAVVAAVAVLRLLGSFD